MFNASIEETGASFPCEVGQDDRFAVCVLPSLFRTGEVTVRVELPEDRIYLASLNSGMLFVLGLRSFLRALPFISLIYIGEMSLCHTVNRL